MIASIECRVQCRVQRHDSTRYGIIQCTRHWYAIARSQASYHTISVSAYQRIIPGMMGQVSCILRIPYTAYSILTLHITLCPGLGVPAAVVAEHRAMPGMYDSTVIYDI